MIRKLVTHIAQHLTTPGKPLQLSGPSQFRSGRLYFLPNRFLTSGSCWKLTSNTFSFGIWPARYSQPGHWTAWGCYQLRLYKDLLLLMHCSLVTDLRSALVSGLQTWLSPSPPTVARFEHNCSFYRCSTTTQYNPVGCRMTVLSYTICTQA